MKDLIIETTFDADAATTFAILTDLLNRGGCDATPEEFRRYGSARQLYNFHPDNAY